MLRLEIKKKNLEWLITGGVFIFSLMNQATLLLGLGLLLLLLFQKEVGGIKILNLLTLRSIVNPGIGVSISTFELLKWGLIFLISSYLIIKSFDMEKADKERIKPLLITFSIFTIYSIVASFISSNLPTVAVFKVISYSVPFMAIVLGVTKTYRKFNWINWMYEMFYWLFLSSLLFITSPVGYLRNGLAFQGITNHPNLFGIVLVIFLSFVIMRYFYSSNSNFFVILIPCIIYIITLSKSRTSFITATALIFLFIIFLKFNKKYTKVIIYIFSSIFIFAYMMIDSSIMHFIKEFLYKGQSQGDLLFSREAQISGIVSNFQSNPLFGVGFGVPVTQIRSYSMSFDAIVEPGNLVIAILSYVGIIGTILFIIYITQMIMMNRENIKYQIYLPIATIMVSFGEMVFFSTNNIGIWLYMCWAIYINYSKRESM